MKRHYDGNPEFQKFIKQAIGLSSLPLGDLEEGLKWLKDNIHFDDEKEESFKHQFLKYIDDYWVNIFLNLNVHNKNVHKNDTNNKCGMCR